MGCNATHAHALQNRRDSDKFLPVDFLCILNSFLGAVVEVEAFVGDQLCVGVVTPRHHAEVHR